MMQKRDRDRCRPLLEILESRTLPALSFAAAVSYSVGTEPTVEVVGDLNTDGKLDAVVTNKVDSTISVLLGNGDGTFAAGGTFGTGLHPFAIAAGDFNHDDNLDVVTASSDSSAASVLLGNGDGSFQAA